MNITIAVERGRPTDGLGFSDRYRACREEGRDFAMIAPVKDGSHWVAVLPTVAGGRYLRVDQGQATEHGIGARTESKTSNDAVISIRLA